MKTILYVAGRSGGHLVPLIAHVQQEKRLCKEARAIVITTDTPMDFEVMRQSSAYVDHHYAFSLGNLPKTLWRWGAYIVRLMNVCVKTFFIIRKHRPVALYTTGSYLSVPVACVAKVMRVPIFVYHLDAVPGRAGAFLHRIAACSYECIPGSSRYLSRRGSPVARVVPTPCPLRFTESDCMSRESACRLLNIDVERKVLLILGGSQGSRSITQYMQGALVLCSDVQKKKLHVLHQCGLQDRVAIQEWYEQHAIFATLFGYDFDLAKYYCAANSIIARAGAVSLAEICFFKKKALVFPLRGLANDHQVKNAVAYEKMHPDLIVAALDTDMQSCINRVREFCNV